MDVVFALSYYVKFNLRIAHIPIFTRQLWHFSISHCDLVPYTCFHDDVIKSKYFPRYWPFVRGIHRWLSRTKASDAERWYFFYLRLNEHWVNDHDWGWWFETPSRPLWRHSGVTNCAIQIKYGLPYYVTCPSMSTDPLNLGTRRSRVPGCWDPGIRTNTGAGDTVWAKHT